MKLSHFFLAAAFVAAPMPAAAHQDAHDMPVLRLAPDGLALVDAESGEEGRVGFGMEQDDAVAAIARALGDPEDSGLNEDCGAGPLAHVDFQGGLRLFFQAGEFSGWTSEGGWTGTNGIGVGITYADLARFADEVEAEETSLGAEFSADGFSGLLSEQSPDGRVSVLWAGTTCTMR